MAALSCGFYVCFILVIATHAIQVASRSNSDTQEWLVQIKGGPEEAERVAKSAGMRLIKRFSDFDDIYVLDADLHHVDNVTGRRKKRSISHVDEHLSGLNEVVWAEHQRVVRRTKRDFMTFDDELWNDEWQINNPDTDKSMKIAEVWAKGYTGRNVVVSVIDDGVDHVHKDLAANYDATSSYDLNGNDSDPTPQYDTLNDHGTRCAGVIGMVANNTMCGVGVSYNAKIAGIRLLDGKITDRSESEAFNYALNRVSIYSCSWGPDDDGATLEGPGYWSQQAFIRGVEKGRGGKGVIYVWASGNGGEQNQQDDCACDGYTSSIFTFSVNSANSYGNVPKFSEGCPGTIATTYSGETDKRIITTDVEDKCTTNFAGTSASAPMAAGIIALVLEANPNLTWRDVQHLAVWTANPAPLNQSAGWYINGAGFLVSLNFGFGLLDALNMVETGKEWITVPKEKTCVLQNIDIPDGQYTKEKPFIFTFDMDGCKDTALEINYIEKIQLVASLSVTCRGHTSIDVISPAGTVTKLLKPRPLDCTEAGFLDWPFTSLHNWGENPAGKWTVVIRDNGDSSTDQNKVNSLSLAVIGTKEPTAYQKQHQKRSYPGVDLQKFIDGKAFRASKIIGTIQ